MLRKGKTRTKLYRKSKATAGVFDRMTGFRLEIILRHQNKIYKQRRIGGMGDKLRRRNPREQAFPTIFTK